MWRCQMTAADGYTQYTHPFLFQKNVSLHGTFGIGNKDGKREKIPAWSETVMNSAVDTHSHTFLLRVAFSLFLFSLNTEESVQPANTCYVIFYLLPVRRMAVTRWLAPKKGIQIKPSRARLDSLVQVTKDQMAGFVTRTVSIVIFCHLFIYFFRDLSSLGVRDAQIIAAPEVNCEARCCHFTNSYIWQWKGLDCQSIRSPQ